MDTLTAQHLYRIEKQIQWHGQPVVFSRKAVNQYGEHTGTSSTVLETEGLFHYSGGHLITNSQESGEIQAAKIPMVLIEYPASVDILTDDLVTINGTTYAVTGLTDIGNEHQILDVSLRGDPDV